MASIHADIIGAAHPSHPFDFYDFTRIYANADEPGAQYEIGKARNSIAMIGLQLHFKANVGHHCRQMKILAPLLLKNYHV